jgi:hypothetical protein
MLYKIVIFLCVTIIYSSVVGAGEYQGTFPTALGASALVRQIG